MRSCGEVDSAASMVVAAPGGERIEVDVGGHGKQRDSVPHRHVKEPILPDRAYAGICAVGTIGVQAIRMRPAP